MSTTFGPTPFREYVPRSGGFQLIKVLQLLSLFPRLRVVPQVPQQEVGTIVAAVENLHLLVSTPPYSTPPQPTLTQMFFPLFSCSLVRESLRNASDGHWLSARLPALSDTELAANCRRIHGTLTLLYPINSSIIVSTVLSCRSLVHSL